MVPCLPSVTIFSATERAALAFAKVVVTRLCLIRLQTRLASIALRCCPVRPSLAVRFRCLIIRRAKLWLTDWFLSGEGSGFFLRCLKQVGLERHPQCETKCSEFFLNFVE